MTDSDFVWAELARHPIRRAMLGRERCDEITATAAEMSPTGRAAAAAGHDREDMRRLWEGRVRDEYAQRAGFAFLTMLIMWAIGAVVQALVKKWWEEHT
jgi:hypothetical protein